MRKFLIVIFSLIAYNQTVWSIDDFSKALEAAQRKDYILADSLFTTYLINNPNDVNARFNKANVKLIMKDTCAFCNDMFNIGNWYDDKEAWELYNVKCGKIDSLYYNDKYELISGIKPRIMIVSVPFNCEKLKVFYVHDMKKKGASMIITPDIMNNRSSDIIASYILKKDGTKTFKFIFDSKPSYPGGKETKDLCREMNADLQQARSELNLHHVYVNVQYVIDKTGAVKDFEILRIEGKLKDDETKQKLESYVTAYFNSMPSHIPAEYRSEKVDYLVHDGVDFW